MSKKLLIRDLTLRDGQQSLFSTRMTQQQIDRLLPLYREANFYAMEVWGGDVPDTMMRHLNENPWSRLEKIKEVLGDSTTMAALSRGRNLFGYNPYPDDVIEGFNRFALSSGVGSMRIFDALNDTENIGFSVKSVKEKGGIADCAICYTVDPYFSRLRKLKAFIHSKPLNTRIFTNEYYLSVAQKLQEMGADIITIKDMAGLIPPGRAGRLVKLMKQNIGVPIDFHTHCTAGYGLASTLMAIVNGVDIVDTNIMSFSGGTAAASYEIIQLFCDKLGIQTGVNRAAVRKIDLVLRDIRRELADFDTRKSFPKDFDISAEKLPRDIDELFELAIAYAKSDKIDDLLSVCGHIERFFGLPEPDDTIREAEIPGRMFDDINTLLKQQKQERLLSRVLELIPEVRMDAGCPPLVAPIRQILATQVVNCAIDESKGKPMYSTKSLQFVNLVKGVYGKSPNPVDPELRYKVTGVKAETPYETRYYKRQENPEFPEYGGVKLAADEKEELLLELFPAVAGDFLKRKVEQNYLDEIHRVEKEKRAKFEAEKREYEKLTPEEKQKRLLEGLYNYNWTSEEEDSLGHS
jgi:oxaloacetate decarboxylase alpha subunit/pyruvate carboxylase subunit B